MRKNVAVPRGQCKPIYPDMSLYQEIILLQTHFKGNWVVENVKPYYHFFVGIRPQLIQRHYFWCNFTIPNINLNADNIERGSIKEWESRFGFNLDAYSFGKRKDQVLKNCVHPLLGRHIFDAALTCSRCLN